MVVRWSTPCGEDQNSGNRCLGGALEVFFRREVQECRVDVSVGDGNGISHVPPARGDTRHVDEVQMITTSDAHHGQAQPGDSRMTVYARLRAAHVEGLGAYQYSRNGCAVTVLAVGQFDADPTHFVGGQIADRNLFGRDRVLDVFVHAHAFRAV